MNELKSRIVRLVRILASPHSEIFIKFELDDGIIINTVSVNQSKTNFEMSVFDYKTDSEIIIPSEFISDSEMNRLILLLEDYLIKN